MDRRASERLRIPTICLMENAGAEAARFARALLDRRRGPVVCACGPGGNGGDAMVVARHLAVAGIDVSLVRFGPTPVGDAGTQIAVCAAMGLATSEVADSRAAARAFAGAALIVDGLYGTGLTRPIDGVAAAIVEAMNASGAPILALDVPSGLDCDAGEPLGPCVRATMTVTFVAPKTGFANPASLQFTGEVRVASIGAPAEWPRPR